ncbi:UNVERIFIED_ORG: hypothetical protein GGE44_004525 [Rhizobium esperanzae]
MRAATILEDSDLIGNGVTSARRLPSVAASVSACCGRRDEIKIE